MAEAGLAAARANLDAARQELARIRSDRDGLIRQRANLQLIAPAAGLVAARNADPGTTVVAGQSVVEVIDPASLWINVRFDQLRVSGLRAGLPVRIVLRSQGGPATCRAGAARGAAGRCGDRGDPGQGGVRFPAGTAAFRRRTGRGHGGAAGAAARAGGAERQRAAGRWPSRRLADRGRQTALRARHDGCDRSRRAGCRSSTGSRQASAWWSTASARSVPAAASRSSSACRGCRHDQPCGTRHPARLGQVRLHRRGTGAADRRDADHGRRLPRHGGRCQGAARQQRRRPVGGAAGHPRPLCRAVQSLRRCLSQPFSACPAWPGRPTSPI